MGIKLIVLLGLVVGALYCLHLLAKDYQAIMAPRFFKLFKRHAANETAYKPHVRWKKILNHDPLRCTQLIFCELGVNEPQSRLQHGLVYMLALQPTPEDKHAHDAFTASYGYGRETQRRGHCKMKYLSCPFSTDMLLGVVDYIVENKL